MINNQMNTTSVIQEEQNLADHLAQEVLNRASGSSTSECNKTLPRDRYFIGNLRPIREGEEDHDAFFASTSEIINKLAPVAFGAEFRIEDDNNEFQVIIKLKWACYYRVFPTYEQQLEHQKGQAVLDEFQNTQLHHASSSTPIQTSTEDALDEDVADNDSEADLLSSDRGVTRRRRDTLFIRFRKIQCEAEGSVHIISQNDDWNINVAELQVAIQEEIERVIALIRQDPCRLKVNGLQDKQIYVPDAALDSPNAYSIFCNGLTDEIIHDWRWTLDIRMQRNNISAERFDWNLSFTFTNSSPMSDRSPNVEPYFLEPHAYFNMSSCNVLPFEVELAPRGFRYDRNIGAKGFNCGVIPFGEGNSTEFITTNTPAFHQMRYVTQMQPTAAFDALATDPIPVLQGILDAMVNYLEVWDEQQVFYEASNNWHSGFAEEYQNARNKFVSEIELFRRGIEILQSDFDAMLAFRLTNETFSRTEKDAWRLFQVVFLVSQIPGTVALKNPEGPNAAERRIVDIVYFPTGGGKTEAYLGTIVFHCFFDRLRGKKAGVTAWTRFPLRLLTIQQTQRAAEVIGLAELVRRAQLDEPRLVARDVAAFAVGYFVGSAATPNEIVQPTRPDSPGIEWAIATDPTERQRWKRVYRCPSCRTNTITLEFDEQHSRLIHRCTNAHCEFPGGRLPVYVVDMEIYRYLPSLIVGTIDKLAGLGNQRKISTIFGKVDGVCRIHGYYVGDKCLQKDCSNNDLAPGEREGLSGPTLFIQDELHLLKEGLGTFDSHYETFAQQLLQEFGQTNALKIIASSATVEAFERQVEHLYGRSRTDSRVFPGLGPTLDESFYAQTLSYPQRIFIGIVPHNKTIFNAILELVHYYHEAIQDLANLTSEDNNPWGGDTVPGSLDWTRLLDSYLTSLTYFRKTLELFSVKTDLQNHVNTELHNSGYQELEIAELTGSTTSDEVAQILEQLETGNSESGSSPDVVLATNMISHGVDINRLNTMIFYGMPLQVAEYIQASSRVGRGHVGIVFMCLHPARERDRSHYDYFTKFHEYLGQLVEPVSINRWSRFSADRTLPGLFMAILLQILANQSTTDSPGRYYFADFVRQKYLEGTITEEDFMSFLEEAYLVNQVEGAGSDAFRSDISIRIRNFLDQIVAASTQTTWVSEAIYPPPMRSLREVDEQLQVELGRLGSRWASMG